MSSPDFTRDPEVQFGSEIASLSLNENGLATSSVKSACTLYKLPPEIRELVFIHAIKDAFDAEDWCPSAWSMDEDGSNHGIGANWEFSDLPPLERALVPERMIYREIFGLRIKMSTVSMSPLPGCRDPHLYPSLSKASVLLRESIRKIMVIPHKNIFTPKKTKPADLPAEFERAREMLCSMAELLSDIHTHLPNITHLYLYFDDAFNGFWARTVGRPEVDPPPNDEARESLLPGLKNLFLRSKLQSLQLRHRSLQRHGYYSVLCVGDFGSLGEALDFGLGGNDEFRGEPPGRCAKTQSLHPYGKKHKYMDLSMTWRTRERPYLEWEETASPSTEPRSAMDE